MSYVALMLLATVLSMGKGIVLPKILVISDYGLYSIYYQSVSVAIPLATLGVLESYMLRYGKARNHNSQVIKRRHSKVFLSLMRFVLLIILTTVFFVTTLSDSVEKVFIVLFSVSLVSQVTFYWFVRSLRFRLESHAFARMISSRILFDMLLLAVFQPSTFVGVVLCEISSFIIITSYLCTIGGEGISLKGFLSHKRLRLFLGRGAPLAGHVVVSALILTVDKLFIGYTHNLNEVGKYNLAFLTSLPFLAAYNLIYQYYLPIINEAQPRYRSLIQLLYAFRIECFYLLVLSALMALAGFFLAPSIFLYFYDYEVESLLLGAIVVGMFFHLNTYFEMFAMASNIYWQTFILNCVVLVIELIMLIGVYYSDLGLAFYGVAFLLSRVSAWVLWIYLISNKWHTS